MYIDPAILTHDWQYLLVQQHVVIIMTIDFRVNSKRAKFEMVWHAHHQLPGEIQSAMKQVLLGISWCICTWWFSALAGDVTFLVCKER